MRLIVISLLLVSCSPKVTQDIYWVNQYGEKAPIVIQDSIVVKPDTIK